MEVEIKSNEVNVKSEVVVLEVSPAALQRCRRWAVSFVLQCLWIWFGFSLFPHFIERGETVARKLLLREAVNYVYCLLA